MEIREKNQSLNGHKEEGTLPIGALKPFPEQAKALVDAALAHELALAAGRKLVVLDDDPTGVQTVHDVSVYTDWSLASVREGFAEPDRLFFILTNSRSFSQEETVRAHEEIARNVAQAAADCGKDYLLVSRGDSTLRGHYPLETEVLRQTLAADGESGKAGVDFDGEILCPFFAEGGRFTLGDVHYVKAGERLIPAAQTEFAKDATFGYRESNLRRYVEEKGRRMPARIYCADACISVPNELLHAADFDAVQRLLEQAEGFQKIVVNATDAYDAKVLAVALYRAMAGGRRYMVRCAAALVKALGGISGLPLLSGERLLCPSEEAEGDGQERLAGMVQNAVGEDAGFANGSRNRRAACTPGGVIAVGSHTKKTTAQLMRLRELENVDFLELDSDLVLQPGALARETARVLSETQRLLAAGRTVCISTRRALLRVEGDTPEQALARSVQISEALQACVGQLAVKPAYVVAKGGITSSDIGVKALRVHRACVLGQIEPGVPVWRTDEGSRFPGIPYVIFPGNVGEEDTLLRAVRTLEQARRVL